MSKNPIATRQDMGQIWKKMFQADCDALRVVHAADVETQISLSAEDGDSVLATTKCVLIQANKEIDCSMLSKLQAYSACEVTLKADETTIVTLQLTAGQCLDICAMKLICTTALVGR